MTEVIVKCGYKQLADVCSQYIGPQKFYLHNRIGGQDWEVIPSGGSAVLRVNHPELITFILLKI
jgi:hypothetical protein